jgi:hypothetical protein
MGIWAWKNYCSILLHIYSVVHKFWHPLPQEVEKLGYPSWRLIPVEKLSDPDM